MAITFQVDIEATLEQVWALLDDETQLPLWMPEIVETVYPEDRDRDAPVGTTFRQKIKEGGRVKDYDGEITAYDPPRKLGIRLGDGQFSVDIAYALSPIGTGTRLDYSAELAVETLLARIMGVLFRPLTMRILNRHMVNLKRVAEDAAAAERSAAG